MVDGNKLIPFIRQFYDNPSTFFWEDELGEAWKMVQGERGEQGDPLMPLLFILGWLWSRKKAKGCSPSSMTHMSFVRLRVGEVYAIWEKALREKTGINIHQGKTKLWNKAGILKVLGVPIGHPSFITVHIAATFKEQALLFERISH